MSRPLVVVVFKGCNVRNSSLTEKSSNTILMKTANWALSLESTDSSHWIENYLHVPMSCSNCLFASSESAETLLAMVFMPNCTSDVADRISGPVLWSLNKESARRVIASLTETQSHFQLAHLSRLQAAARGKITVKLLIRNQNQKSFNVLQMGKFVCHSSDTTLQTQKHITITGTIAKISNEIKKGRKTYIHIYTM